MTPAVMFLAAVGFLLMAFRRQGRALLVLALPAGLVLALVPPSDGLWRLLPLFPFACAAAAYALTSVRLLARLGLVIPIVAITAYPFLPQYIPAPEGAVQFWRVYLRNPQLKPGQRFHSARSPQTLPLAYKQKVEIPVVLKPGAWAPIIGGTGTFQVTIDGKIPATISTRPPHVQLHDGWFHTIEIETFSICEVTFIQMRRLGEH
jgi:hypothetical protein